MGDYRFDDQLALGVRHESVRALAKAHVEGRLRLRPAFQRNLVWNKRQKSYLVDSILRNFPIPEVYIQSGEVTGTLEEMLTVVDGQQRISTCIEFLTDELRLTGDRLPAEWDGRKFSELDPRLQTQFSRYRFIVRELPDLEDAQIREIFTRLNRVVEPLTPQELRHAAFSGQFIQLVEALASHPVLPEIRVFSAKDFRRRGNDELVAEIVYAHVQGAFPNKKEGLDEAFRHFEDNGLPEATERDVLRRFGRLFALLEGAELTIRTTRFSNKSDFYSLAVYLLGRAESLPLKGDGVALFSDALEDLSARITAFRRTVAAGEEIEPATAGDELALKYMRAVERAASDRLSRVRRDDVLSEWLGPALAKGNPRPLDAGDEEWLEQLSDLEEEAAAEVDAEREHLRDVLLRDA